MRKIEIFADGKYIATTTRHKTCKAAKANIHGLLAVAGRGIIDTTGKRITAHFAN